MDFDFAVPSEPTRHRSQTWSGIQRQVSTPHVYNHPHGIPPINHSSGHSSLSSTSSNGGDLSQLPRLTTIGFDLQPQSHRQQKSTGCYPPAATNEWQVIAEDTDPFSDFLDISDYHKLDTPSPLAVSLSGPAPPCQRSLSNTTLANLGPVPTPGSTNPASVDALKSLDTSPPAPHSFTSSTAVNGKKSSRQNPWGHETYADLITAAIESHPDQKATLQQVYEYISTKYEYFKERSDPASSSGWKNSIRHNLSLHDKFMKCAKTSDTVKSSYWRVNHDSIRRPYLRRRANSMETNKSTSSSATISGDLIKKAATQARKRTATTAGAPGVAAISNAEVTPLTLTAANLGHAYQRPISGFPSCGTAVDTQASVGHHLMGIPPSHTPSSTIALASSLAEYRQRSGSNVSTFSAVSEASSGISASPPSFYNANGGPFWCSEDQDFIHLDRCQLEALELQLSLEVAHGIAMDGCKSEQVSGGREMNNQVQQQQQQPAVSSLTCSYYPTGSQYQRYSNYQTPTTFNYTSATNSNAGGKLVYNCDSSLPVCSMLNTEEGADVPFVSCHE